MPDPSTPSLSVRVLPASEGTPRPSAACATAPLRLASPSRWRDTMIIPAQRISPCGRRRQQHIVYGAPGDLSAAIGRFAELGWEGESASWHSPRAWRLALRTCG